MKCKRVLFSAATILAFSLALVAQDTPRGDHKHHNYKLYDMGTFGGPNGVASIFATSLTPAGAVGAADTPLADPFDPNCLFSDCYVGHAIHWRKGILTDLGAIPGNNGRNSSYSFAINEKGVIVGTSETGAIDPDTGYPEAVAVVWKHGHLENLGTLGGAQSMAASINNRGQLVGWAMNTTPDPYSVDLEYLGYAGIFPGSTQLHATLWDDTGIHDLGTLGGPSSLAYIINQRGQVAGHSYTNFTPNPTTGIPTVDAFLWDRGKMTDLGSLGGTETYPAWLNNSGQVVGTSNLPGDQTWHGFVWERGRLTDLSLGGSYASANWINDSGDVVGSSYLPGNHAYHSFLWSHRSMIDLGTLEGDECAVAYGINSARQLVGASYHQCDANGTRTAFLSENGGAMVDLNALVQPHSDINVYAAWYIDDRGQIVGQGALPNGQYHMVVLVPDGDCDSACEKRIAVTPNQRLAGQPATAGERAPAVGSPAARMPNRQRERFPFSGRAVIPHD